MISVKQNFQLPNLFKELDQSLDRQIDHVIDSLRKSGKEIVDRARMKTKSDGGFGNVTWNLRASIGYIIVKDHKPLELYFPPIGNGDQGHKNGIAYANEVASYIDDGGIILVIVAGENYAALVEAKGYDVISGSCNEFLAEFRRMLIR